MAEPASIFVVDDDPDLRELLGELLAEEGYAARLVENGRKALDLLASGVRPALILLDLMMPEMNGFEFLDEVRQRDDWRNIPIIVVTARDVTAEDRARLNGRVESVIQKAGRDDMWRQVTVALAKCVERQSGEKAAVA